MTALSKTQSDLLDDIAFENPPPEEKWFGRDWFDPPHDERTVRSLARAGYIELSEDGQRFRFTLKGRTAHAERSSS